jgi:hypothetical protein
MSFEAVLAAEKLDLAGRCCDATACCLFIERMARSLSKWTTLTIPNNWQLTS